MANVRIVGYSADNEEAPLYAFRAFIPKTKCERNKEKQAKLFSKKEPLELNEWFVYKVDGEKWYYKNAQDIKFLKTHHKEVEFLGVGKPNSEPSKTYTLQNEKVKIRPSRVYGYCCYCNVKLRHPNNKDPESFTRDHIIPKSRGGKIVKPCCYRCNQEKGDLMLHSYIQLLNYMQGDMSPGSNNYKLTQIKIDNANKIAMDIEK